MRLLKRGFGLMGMMLLMVPSLLVLLWAVDNIPGMIGLVMVGLAVAIVYPFVRCLLWFMEWEE